MSGPLFKESGQDGLQRAEEADKIINKLDLGGAIEDMEPNERRFVLETADRLAQYGLNTIITPKQVFWLRDLLQKYR